LARKKQTPKKKKEKEILFTDLDLSEEMLNALEDAGYEKPSPIQAGLIPLALDELDVVGQAQTGTGKTAAFAIPILELLEPLKVLPKPQALILVPTRELAVQVRGEVVKLASGYREVVNAVAVYGGKPIRAQISKLSDGAQIVVGTPGRVLDLIGRGALRLEDVCCVVLDEADRMLDIGFRPDIEKILRRCPTDRQTLLLSATVPPPIERLAQRYMQDPKKLDFSPVDISVDTIEQFYFTVEHERKFDLLVRLMEREEPSQSIIFCRTRRGVDRTARRLGKKLKGVNCIHGDMAQRDRDKVMLSFREKKVQHLVATDVIGRGIDVSSVSHIVNFDVPQFCDDYVHRVGRTGRMGREGVAYTFVTVEEGGELTRIEQRINKQLQRDEIKGFSTITPIQKKEESAAKDDKDEPPALSNSRRPRKRYRRAL